MNTSASIPDEDEQDLSAQYEAAFAEFAESGDAELWDTVNTLRVTGLETINPTA